MPGIDRFRPERADFELEKAGYRDKKLMRAKEGLKRLELPKRRPARGSRSAAASS